VARLINDGVIDVGEWSSPRASMIAQPAISSTERRGCSSAANLSRTRRLLAAADVLAASGGVGPGRTAAPGVGRSDAPACST
jgi:hypothetical protein